MSNASHEYTRRIDRVIDYLRDNLDEPLRLGDLAKVACFSEYHFHRVFGVITGKNVNDFANRLRLEKAARQNEYLLSMTDEEKKVAFPGWK